MQIPEWLDDKWPYPAGFNAWGCSGWGSGRAYSDFGVSGEGEGSGISYGYTRVDGSGEGDGYGYGYGSQGGWGKGDAECFVSR